MKPWRPKNVKSNSYTVDMLQLGHGDEAVETAYDPFLPASEIQLQLGHGDEAVETRRGARCPATANRSFNWATAMKPWRRYGCATR